MAGYLKIFTFSALLLGSACQEAKSEQMLWFNKITHVESTYFDALFDAESEDLKNGSVCILSIDDLEVSKILLRPKLFRKVRKKNNWSIIAKIINGKTTIFTLSGWGLVTLEDGSVYHIDEKTFSSLLDRFKNLADEQNCTYKRERVFPDFFEGNLLPELD